MNKIQLESAFVLHSRPYQETSLLVDFFTLNYGKVTALARSARGIRSRFKGSLLPFSPVLISCVGKNDFWHLHCAENHSVAYFLQGHNLFNGIYLNELLLKLLQRLDPFPNLFHYYQNALQKLEASHEEPQISLRVFEKQLLTELGYGLQLKQEVNGEIIESNKTYLYRPQQGVVACAPGTIGPAIFEGSHLLAFDKNQFEGEAILKAAKRLMRLALGSLLGPHPLKSRELFFVTSL